MTKLFSLHLDGNKIKILKKGAFEGLRSVKELHVGNNLIHNADFYSLNGLQSVSLITMQNNSLTTLPYLGNLTQVTTVRFSFNMFDLENQTAVFTNLGELVILSMHEAKLRRIPDLSQNPNLLYLFVSKNRIKYIKDGAFLFNSKLEQLMMNSNNIEILTNESFTGATSLETINLSDNPLKQIAHSTFFHESLKTVFLIDTMLKHPLLISTVSHPIISFVL
ncbi:leucine-rich repeat-containing G-protein coupled receptor 4-like [Actinia tenebrosa]|uniref:Leucine-rich repeat-containing G-protein coupled receptor 4-like n=1 Tax=Actinia tenebrosa TaxID=6105 RepID=A0A6P8H8D6_ACTTE|nr:leucine-rich repeat-containing G-protein coupled receptor 4-like [Actinia tenebrosa]